MNNIFETTAYFEKELKNNFLSLKKTYIYPKNKKKIHLTDFNDSFGYFSKTSEEFDEEFKEELKEELNDYEFAPVENLILKNTNFAGLQMRVRATRLQIKKSKKENIGTLFKTDKKKVFLLSTESSLDIKYKSILAKIYSNHLNNSFIKDASKKNLFIEQEDNFFLPRGSFDYYKKEKNLHITFPHIENNFVNADEREYFSFKIERVFGKDLEKKEKEIKTEDENNRKETENEHIEE